MVRDIESRLRERLSETNEENAILREINADLLAALVSADAMIRYVMPVVAGDDADAHEWRRDRAAITAAIAKAKAK
jgi:hypothetical protein